MRLAIDFDGQGEDEVLDDLERYDLTMQRDQQALIMRIEATIQDAWKHLPENLRRKYQRRLAANKPMRIAAEQQAKASAAESGGRPSPDDIARLFHETYERLAPDFGYKTREASAVPWDDVPDANRNLMISVARVVWDTVYGTPGGTD